MKKIRPNSPRRRLSKRTLQSLSLIVILLLTSQLSAQITITNSIFPLAGEFRYTSRDTTANGAAITPPGAAAQSWKFNAFVPWQADTVAVIDASLGGAAASFPEADIVYPFFGGEGYFDNAGDSLELLGFFGDPGFGVSFLVELSSSSVILKTPINFNDTFEDDFSFVQAIDPDDFPELGPLLPAFPPIDSIRAIYFSHREDTVDAWGSMSTHLGSFDVLRAKSVDYTNLTIEFKSFGFWIDPASIGIEIPFGGMDTSVTYNFLNDIEKVPIVSVNMNNDGSIGSVVYLVDPDLVTSVNPIDGVEWGIEIFPNPASDFLNIRITDQPGQRFNLMIYDINGRLVRSLEDFSGNGEINSFSLEGFIPGVYYLNVLDRNGQFAGVRKVVIH